MLSQIITGGLSLSLVAVLSEARTQSKAIELQPTVGHSGGSALGAGDGGGRDGGGGVEDLRLASYGPGNSS